ncbi:MAG: hypothetical protein D5R96_04510 [Methanocalculus sp. MSAO_Arc2]|uniref:hypothetical protein n=1 Tax=Methanocalculus sp. MSAO_Arc2 TaxID=2293855 RepID=UPI000FF310C1|nr:MAG: hypothetical protein D5R96_04510 [Methanocalculus sp. MSAO_Arc2]
MITYRQFILTCITVILVVTLLCIPVSADRMTVESLEIIDRSVREVTADYHVDHWHGRLPVVIQGKHISLGAVFTGADGKAIPLMEEDTFYDTGRGTFTGDYIFNVRLADGAPTGIVTLLCHGDHVHVRGQQAGETNIVFQLQEDDKVVWESPSIGVNVRKDDTPTEIVGDGTIQIAELKIIDRSVREVTADHHFDHWHGRLPVVTKGTHISLGAEFTTEDGEKVPLMEEDIFYDPGRGVFTGAYIFNVRLADGAPRGIVELLCHGDHVHVRGQQDGRTALVFMLQRDDDVVWESAEINVMVEDPDMAPAPAEPAESPGFGLLAALGGLMVVIYASRR